MPVAEARAWVAREVGAARASLEAELASRGAALGELAASQADAWSGARETLLARCAELEAALGAARMGAGEASAERDALIADLQASVADLRARLAYAEGEAVDELRLAMREAAAVERATVEERARAQLALAVQDAVAAGIAEKEAALAALRAECEARLAECMAAAEAVRAAERAALEAAHRSQVEMLIAQSLAERDASAAALQEQRARELLAAQAQADEALARAGAEARAAQEALRAAGEERCAALAGAAASDLGEAMSAAREEMTALLAATDQAWQERSSGLLAAQAQENQAALAIVLEASKARLAAAVEAGNAAAMAREEALTRLLARHEAAVPALEATLTAALEADKVAALAAFNAEWVARLEARVAELMDSRSAELAALKAEYQAHMDGVVAALEAQRQGALSAFSAEFNAERERLLAEKANAVAEAVRAEREAAGKALAIALARAEEEKQLLLVEQAEKLAEERAAALAAMRQQATEEHEEANDALRLESEKLLVSIEGAMSKLRDERDVAAEDRELLRAQLAAEQERTADLRESVAGLRRAGTVANMRSYILAGRYVSEMARVRSEAEARRVADLAACAASWAARLAAEEAVREEWNRKFVIMCETREELVDALTNFKRDLLVQHKVKSVGLVQAISGLSTHKAELQREVMVLTSQVKEAEGSIRTLETETHSLNKESVIGPGGAINEALQKRKKRMARDMDTALVRMEDRRKALQEVAERARGVDEERAGKEAELKAVEANLVSTLVAQQRQIKAILDDIPLSPEELEVPREQGGGQGEEELDGEGQPGQGEGGPGGEGGQHQHQQHQHQQPGPAHFAA